MPGKILIADDEAYMTEILAFKLRAAGFEVATAGDGSEALKVALAMRPDAIVTDYQMPNVSGFELAKNVKSDPRTSHIPMIMLTARGHLLTAAQLAQTNIRFLLPKPFSARDLLTKVQEMLEKQHEPLTLEKTA